jgi:hypothetical protein
VTLHTHAISTEKLARFTNNLGTNYLESLPELLQGECGGTRKICMEGVKIAQFLFKLVDFYPKLQALSALKKRPRCGLPLIYISKSP